MSSGFEDFDVSARTVEIIKTIVRKEIERQRPAPKVAQVSAINEADKTLSVVYTGEQVAVKIPYANVVPAYVGQFVRINGTQNDRYIEAVLGTDVTSLTATDGAALAEVANNGAIDAGDQATSIGSQLDTNLDAIRSNRPIGDGPDPTGESNIRWDAITPASDGTPPTIPVKTNSYPWAFVRCGLTRNKETLSFAATKTGQVLTFFYDIYVINTTTGVSNKVYTSQDISGAVSSVLSFIQLNYDMQSSEAGKAFGIQFRMTGSGSINIVGKTNVFPVPITGLYPPGPGGVRPYSSGAVAPDSFPTGEMSLFYGGPTPYVQMGSALGNLDLRRHWFDYANRANGGPGSNWTLRSAGGGSNLVIDTNTFLFGGGTDGYQFGIWNLPMNSDYARVYGTFTEVSPMLGGLILGSAGDMMGNFVTVGRYSNIMHVATATAYNNGATVRTQINNVNAQKNDVIGLRYEPLNNSYVVDLNGVDVPELTWVDTDNIITRGVGKRYAGQFHGRLSYNNSSRLDNWGADDL